MAPTSKDGSRRENCPLFVEETVMRRVCKSGEQTSLCNATRGQVLVPAAAVTPTLEVPIVDAAVKKSVVVAAIKRCRSSAPSLLPQGRVAERTGSTV